ncbi:vomeronasal type-2 receptor 1 [Myripristis murdjan]|uniref:vomeronasal type-2 receptor 1 n=1 Tax=Myripristis murdjan TaxID=586833 RepID=UPI001175FAD1|nr:vomeronasal type-2 receptor 1-like [Myripristis murdjan]
MEISHLLLGLCAFLHFHKSVSAESTCKLKAKFNLNGYKDVEKKKVVVGGMFPVHQRVTSTDGNTSSVPVSSGCEGFNFRTFRWTQTMLFAIEEINLRTDLLPKTDLGYVIYDSCFTISKAVEGTLTYLTGQDEAVPNYRCGDGAPLAALVGAGGSDLSIATARILGLYHFPQVSYFSSCSALESKFQFPTFLRTIPNDVHQSTAIAKLVLHFGWTWVGTIAADDDYGKYGIKEFKEQVEEAGVCISFSETLPKVSSPEDIQRIVDTVVESTAKIIVVFSSDVDLSPLIVELLRHNVTNRTWIASEAWVTSALINQPGVSSVLGGTLGFGVKRANIPGLQSYLLSLDPYADSLTEEFWETAFNCTLNYGKALREARERAKAANSTLSRAARAVPDGLCTGKESLQRLNSTYSDVSQLRITYNVYKAVYAVAHALHNLEHCVPGQGPFNRNSCAEITSFEPWQLMYYLKNVRFNVPHTEEEIFFNDGDVDGYYDIINWQVKGDGELSYVIVGSYNGTAQPEARMTIQNESIVWNNEDVEHPRSVCSENCQPGTRKGIRQGEPVCCFDCIPCADGEISNTTNARECIQCSEDYWSNAVRDTCVPKTIEFLAFGEPLGITLIVISAFGALVTIAVGVVFIVNLGTPLVKANDALLSFSLLFSLVVTFLCSIVFLGEPQPWSCMTSQVALALGFALCLSSIMGKAAVLMLRAQALKAARAKAKAAAKAAKAAAEAAANSGNPDVIVTNTNNNNNTDSNPGGNPEKDKLTFAHQRAIAAVATLIQAVACTVWLIILPPHPVKNTAAQNVKIILECDEGSVVFICCIFAYDILLALLAFIFAFIARKLEDHLSEAKCVTFGMLVFFIVWISFVPAYLSTRGKFMVAVQIFAILASSFGLLACIFLPKCYVLLVKPERNTEEMMRPRSKPRDGTSTGTSASLATAATEVNATIASTAIDD